MLFINLFIFHSFSSNKYLLPQFGKRLLVCMWRLCGYYNPFCNYWKWSSFDGICVSAWLICNFRTIGGSCPAGKGSEPWPSRWSGDPRNNTQSTCKLKSLNISPLKSLVELMKYCVTYNSVYETICVNICIGQLPGLVWSAMLDYYNGLVMTFYIH